MSKFNRHIDKKYLIISGAIFVALLLGFGGYQYWRLYQLNISLWKRVLDSESKSSPLYFLLASLVKDKPNLAAILQVEQGKNTLFESQIRDISGTVGTLRKLAEVDKELLKKYSKVYFLNENYVPQELTSIDGSYLFSKSKPQLIHTRILPHLTDMLNAAKQDGAELQVVSAYRSFYDQESVKSGYQFIYGAGTANQFSADQGYSEHQLGTAVDLTDPKTKALIAAFEKTSSYAWLAQNAYRFGFTLSYPKNNSYYTFEPWHWRFVGVALAKVLHDSNRYFYDMSQTEIDQYILPFFD